MRNIAALALLGVLWTTATIHAAGKAATHVEGQFVVTPSPTGQEGVILPDMPLRAHYERQRHDPIARGAFVVTPSPTGQEGVILLARLRICPYGHTTNARGTIQSHAERL